MNNCENCKYVEINGLYVNCLFNGECENQEEEENGK